MNPQPRSVVDHPRAAPERVDPLTAEPHAAARTLQPLRYVGSTVESVDHLNLTSRGVIAVPQKGIARAGEVAGSPPPRPRRNHRYRQVDQAERAPRPGRG
jgi:hypothetical protein